MRIRTLLAFGVGAAVGAGAAYLGDPDHGSQRRGEARAWALAQGRQGATATAGRVARAAAASTAAAVEGFREGRPAA